MCKYYILFFIFLFIWGFFIEPNLIMVKQYKVDFLSGKKVVFLSDLHIAKGDKRRLNRIINKVNALKPDLVLLGGDYIKGHDGKSTMPIEDIAKELSKITAPKISILGNHDGWYDKYRVKRALEDNGIKVLINSSTKFEDLYISGVDDLQTGYPEVNVALENTEFPRILLTHTPDIYYDIKENVDLILAGHVHGGQVRLPFIGALICPSEYGNKFSGGNYKETDNRMIVSRGLGTSILSVRFFDIPEIILLK